jgi:hypothetical protein
VDKIVGFGWCNNSGYDLFLFSHVGSGDFAAESRKKLRELMSEYLMENSGPPVGLNAQKQLLLAAFARIPEAFDLAAKWAPPVQHTNMVSMTEFPAIVVLARNGDAARAAQAIACLKDRKFEEYYWRLLSFTKSEEVYIYLRNIFEAEKGGVHTDPDVVFDFRSISLNCLASMVEGLRGFLAPQRYAQILNTDENIQKALHWMDSQSSITFR